MQTYICVIQIDKSPSTRYNDHKSMEDVLTWEDSFAIARALMLQYPDIDLENVSLGQILEWTQALPNFEDDLRLCNDTILLAIYREWFEEVSSI